MIKEKLRTEFHTFIKSVTVIFFFFSWRDVQVLYLYLRLFLTVFISARDVLLGNIRMRMVLKHFWYKLMPYLRKTSVFPSNIDSVVMRNNQIKSLVEGLGSLGRYEKEVRWIYMTCTETRQKIEWSAPGGGEVSNPHSGGHLVKILKYSIFSKITGSYTF